MSYWNIKTSNLGQSSDNYITRYSGTVGGVSNFEFFELEPAVVLDIVLDNSHKIFSNNDTKVIGENSWEADLNGKIPLPNDKDFTWIGRALVRLVYSNKRVSKEKLIWALPLESNFSEYPLINEMVVVGKYFGKYYYSRKLNYSNLVNHNLDFQKEFQLGGGPNLELNENILYKGTTSQISITGGKSEEGVAGRYFWVNKNVRSLKRHEGDTILESRFGQSIRFGSYSDDRKQDVGDEKNSDYFGPENGSQNNSFSGTESGGGNPMILIRNRQRKILNENEVLELQNSPNPATAFGTPEEKNVGGYLSENINHDGSSIHITTGLTESEWMSTCYKNMFGVSEEIPAFSGNSSFVYPKLTGDQIVINTDRLILSSRYGETFHSSKKRYSIVTDSEYTVDAHDQMVFTTHTKTVFNSPAIYLGEYDNTNEPALLGQTTVNWLYELCNWLLDHSHWYIHAHVDAGKESPSKTQLPVQIQQLRSLRDKLHFLMSRRVFITGGGFSPGQNGANIPGGIPPTTISVSNGAGVPGGFAGTNSR